MSISMNVHWVAVVLLLIGSFAALHYLNLDEESKLKSAIFHSLLFLTFASSGLYIWRAVSKLPGWEILELVGLGLCIVVFWITFWTYYQMWRSRKKR